MLQGMQAEISEFLGLGVRVDGDHATLFAEFIERRHLAVSL
jgi:hypothetical protein